MYRWAHMVIFTIIRQENALMPDKTLKAIEFTRQWQQLFRTERNPTTGLIPADGLYGNYE